MPPRRLPTEFPGCVGGSASLRSPAQRRSRARLNFRRPFALADGEPLMAFVGASARP